MSFWKILYKSLFYHKYAHGLSVFSIAMGIALLVAVISLKVQSHDAFTQAGLGIDAVLAPKGSPLQIVLNAVYHLEEMPGKIRWTYYQEVEKHPVVSRAVPFVVGHSYRGVRVNAVDHRFFTEFEYVPGKTFSVNPDEGGKGRLFEGSHEAVAGWLAAKQLGIKPGLRFNPVCGVNENDPVHENDPITFVGVLAPTGTPHDRAIYIPLKTFYGLDGHPEETVRMAALSEYREISGAYIQLRRIRGGAMHPGVQDLKFAINQSDQNQLVVPAEVMPRLYHIIGWIDQVLLAIALMLTLLSSLFLFCTLLQSLRETRKDLALFRILGASRFHTTGLVLSQAIVISTTGGILGLFFGHLLIHVCIYFIKIETGLAFSALNFGPADWLVLPGTLALGVTAGLLPAIQSYRTDVIDHLANAY